MMDERPQAADSSPSLDLAGDERPEIRGQRRIHRRWRQGGDRRAPDRRTRLSLWRLYVRGRDREPRAGDRRAVRAGRRFRRNLTAQPDLEGESVLASGFSRGRGHAGESLGRTPFRRLQTRRPRRRSPLARARLQRIARASREQPRTRPRAADKSPKARRLPRSPGLASSGRARAPAESSAQDGRRSPPDPTASAAPSTAQTDPFGAQLVGALRRGRVVRSSTPRRRAPQTQTSRPAQARSPLAPRPRLRRSGRSTSIFRREASRMSR